MLTSWEGFSALESYAKLRPTAMPYLPPRQTFVVPSSTPVNGHIQRLICPPPRNLYWPPHTPFPLQNSQIPPLQQLQAENAPPVQPALPIRPAQTHSPQSRPYLKQPLPKSLAPKGVQPKGPASEPARSPRNVMRTSSAGRVSTAKTNNQLLSSSNTVPSSPLPPPLSREVASRKRERVTQDSTTIEDKSSDPSPLAALKPRPTQDPAEVPPTASDPTELANQDTTQSASSGQVRLSNTYYFA